MDTLASTISIKKDSWFKLGLEQGKEGVEFDVWAHPRIEEYFKSVSQEKYDNLEGFGYRKWFSGHGDVEFRKNYPQLKMSKLKDKFIYSMQGRMDYSFDYVGYPINSEEIPHNIANLAFLRIPGISEGEGIKFQVEGVASNETLRQMKPRLGQAVRAFVMEYLVPVRFELEIIGREI